MDKITQIINDWDPIGMFPMAPENEYAQEINLIYEYIFCGELITVDQLALFINKVFIEQFGRDIYFKNINDCKYIANKILTR